MVRVLPGFALLLLSAGFLHAQDDVSRHLSEPAGESSAPISVSTQTIPLQVPSGTALPVVLDKEVRIRKVGQPIHAKIAEPVYAFDKLVVPAGSEVSGEISKIDSVSSFQRALAALDADFTPARNVQLTFNELLLPDGHRMSLHTQVALGSGSVLQFTTSPDSQAARKEGLEKKGKVLASQKIDEAKQEVNHDWQTAKRQFATPGKVHRAEHMLLVESPVRPQYFEAGTRFNAELLEPLDFGTEQVSADKLQMVGTHPAPGSVVHALLKTPLSSAWSHQGDVVEAVMTEPLTVNNQLILPEGTLLKGSVLQVRPARHMHRNGQLRIVFHQIIPPGAAQEHLEASLEGVEVDANEHLSLDSEGGAQTTTPKTRYLATGFTLVLAASMFTPDADAGAPGQSFGEAGGRAVSGASGFRLVGLIIGALSRSRPLAGGLGAYGAGMSVYYHFLSRGRDVVYLRDTAMVVGFGSRITGTGKAAQESKSDREKSLDSAVVSEAAR